jgi:hypothetical protein
MILPVFIRETPEDAPYSSALAPCDLFLSPESKSSLKGTHFQSTEGIRKETAELLKAVSQNYFRRCLEAKKALWGDV